MAARLLAATVASTRALAASVEAANRATASAAVFAAEQGCHGVVNEPARGERVSP
jgi:hypothetical protein